MAKYVVQEQEGVTEVDIVGTMFKPGSEVELQEDVAAPLVESGKLVPEEVVDAAAKEAEATADAPLEATGVSETPKAE